MDSSGKQEKKADVISGLFQSNSTSSLKRDAQVTVYGNIGVLINIECHHGDASCLLSGISDIILTSSTGSG